MLDRVHACSEVSLNAIPLLDRVRSGVEPTRSSSPSVDNQHKTTLKSAAQLRDKYRQSVCELNGENGSGIVRRSGAQSHCIY